MDQNELPAGVVKVQKKIERLYEGNDKLKNTDEELDEIQKNLSKMYGRHEEQYCQAATDHLFGLAEERMQNDHDKEVL